MSLGAIQFTMDRLKDTDRVIGTSGQVLTSYGTSGVKWATPSGGGGSIGGATVTNQVAFGSATASEITSDSTFTFAKNGQTGSQATTLFEVGDGNSSDNTSFGSVFITAKQVDDSTSRARFQLETSSTPATGSELRGYLQCSGTSSDVTLLSNGNLVLESAGKVQIDGGSTNDIIIASASGSSVGIGTTNPQSKLQVAGGIQMGTDGAAANIAAKAGTLRYIEDEVAGAGNSNSYVQMYMRTGTSTYDWTTIIRNNW